MFFLSHLRSGWNALAEKWARYCSPFLARIIYPCAVECISSMSGHFFICFITFRLPLSECFIIIVWQIVWLSQVFCEPLFLSLSGCRRVLTPRCSMISHLQKEQGLGGFEPPPLAYLHRRATSAHYSPRTLVKRRARLYQLSYNPTINFKRTRFIMTGSH